MFALILAATSLPGCRGTHGRGPLSASYWVWNRDEPLSEEEERALQAAGVHRLFWQVGELEMLDSGLGWTEQHPLPKDTPWCRFVPTLRIHASAASPSLWGDSLAAILKPYQDCQLDFDCKTSRLDEYRAALHRVRAALPGRRLSITALAHWPRATHWRELMQEVDEVFPMFYDLEPDPPLVPGKRPRPMIDLTEVAKWSKAWASCPIPWHLGLPNMTRLTVFDRDGARHLRSWDLELLKSLGPPEAEEAPALTLSHSHEKGSQVTALRRPSLGDLAAAMQNGSVAGAAGVIWFSLPQPDRAARGWSVAQLRHLPSGPCIEPSLSLASSKVEGGYQLSLTNTGDQDLIDDVGCVLRLQLPPGGLKEVLPGAFLELSLLANREPATDPRQADTIRLRFDRLDAGESISTGLVRFSSSKPAGGLFWCVESASIHQEIPARVLLDE